MTRVCQVREWIGCCTSYSAADVFVDRPSRLGRLCLSYEDLR
jgi:hypothetical protein